MTLWRRVTPTIVWVSLLAALAGTGVITVITGKHVLDGATEHMAVLTAHVRTEAFDARCRAEPTAEPMVLPNGDRLRTFDLAHLPTAPDGPDPALLREILAGAPSASRLLMLRRYGGVVLMRLAPSGPCSLIEVQWKIDKPGRVRSSLIAIALAGLSALLTGLLSALVVVRPLIARVQRLGSAATGVGSGPAYASAADAGADELGALSTLLDGAHERIESATRELVERNRRLESHLADIAHDLKTPLSAVQLALEQAARAGEGVQVQEMAKRCLDDCVYLAAMIDNLRVGTQLSDGVDPGADGARAELGELVTQVTRRLKPLGRYRGVELDMAGPEREVWCGCRPLALERVIDNLVYNAVSHGRPGDHVAVLLEADAGRFRLTVLDDGPGLPPEELAALGRRRFRGAGAELKVPHGTGLGLAIVGEVCRLCGWQLSFEANEPRGLRVVVSGPEAGRPGDFAPLHSSSKSLP